MVRHTTIISVNSPLKPNEGSLCPVESTEIKPGCSRDVFSYDTAQVGAFPNLLSFQTNWAKVSRPPSHKPFVVSVSPKKLSISSNEGSWKVWWVTGIPLKHSPALPNTPLTPTLVHPLSPLPPFTPAGPTSNSERLALGLARFLSHALLFFDVCCHDDDDWQREGVHVQLCLSVYIYVCVSV